MIDEPTPGRASGLGNFGSYQLLLELASGGMATVFLARQLGAGGFERVVVLKRVHPHLLRDKAFADMFRDEGRIASMVRHPNVVPVIDIVETDRELLLVMEYVESCSLSTLCKATWEARERLSAPVAVRIVVDALSGLHAAHEATDLQGKRLEIVHRDVSPQNVVVSVDGSTRLLDFGVAKAENRLVETQSGGLKGKWGYMAPEQMSGQPVDRRADLFAAAAVLWESLAGRRLFSGDNELDTIRRIMEGRVPLLHTLHPDIPTELDPVLLRGLDRDPKARFQTAADFADALEQAVRPASHREVASMLERTCGPRLAERRAALKTELSRGPEAAMVSISKQVAEVPHAPVTNPIARTEAPEVDTVSLSASSRERVSHRPAASTTSPPPASSSSGTWAKIGIGAGLVAAVAFLVLLTMKKRAEDAPPNAALPTQILTTPSATPSATALPDVAPSASAAPPATKDVELTLVAPSAVESVRVAGLSRVTINGAQVKLVVPPWTGALAIEATLVGGKLARTTATMTGSHDLVLAIAAQPATPGKAAKTKGELQANPYGEQ